MIEQNQISRIVVSNEMEESIFTVILEPWANERILSVNESVTVCFNLFDATDPIQISRFDHGLIIYAPPRSVAEFSDT